MKELGQPLVTYSMILDAFQREFPSSGYKNAVTLKRRLNTLVRKKVEVAANVDVFVSETIHMMVRTTGESFPCPQDFLSEILILIHIASTLVLVTKRTYLLCGLVSIYPTKNQDFRNLNVVYSMQWVGSP